MSAKKRRIGQENRGFKKEWTDDYAFVENAIGLPTCLICNESLSNNKKSNVQRHFMTKHNEFNKAYPEGDARKLAVQEMLHTSNETESVFSVKSKSCRNTTSASFLIAQEVVKQGKPFTYGEYMKECFVDISEHIFNDFENKEEIIQKIKDMPLSAKNIRNRTIRMAEDISNQLIADLYSTTAFSIACDKSSNEDDIANVVLICRYMNSQGPQEELIDVLPITVENSENDIASALGTHLRSKGIDLDKIISVVSNAVPCVKGGNFVSLFKKQISHPVLSFHFMIHEDVLFTQTFSEIKGVMDLVLDIVNKIMTKPLYHRKFYELFKKLSSEYSDLSQNKIRWICKGGLLMQFSNSLEEIKVFLKENQLKYPQLEDSDWLQKFYFMVDITSHLNVLNKNMQGKGNTAITLLDEVISFEHKLQLFASDLENQTLLHFPTLKAYNQLLENTPLNFKFFKILLNIQSELNDRFEELKRYKASLSFLLRPLEINFTELIFSCFPHIDIAQFQLELEDLKTKDLWNSKFILLKTELEQLEREKSHFVIQQKWTDLENLKRQDQVVFDTWNSLPDSYIQLKSYAFGLLSIFGSTHFCEKIFSNMNFIKNKFRNQLNNASFSSCLKMKVTKYSPNIEKLSQGVQTQKSH